MGRRRGELCYGTDAADRMRIANERAMHRNIEQLLLALR